MTKLKLGHIENDKPVKVTHELPAALFRDLKLYARLLSENGEPPLEPVKLIAPMLERFIATDRAFAKARRSLRSSETGV
jgi:hypothetical protein